MYTTDYFSPLYPHAGCMCMSTFIIVYGCVFGFVYVLDVALLGWSSFKSDAEQVTNG